MSREAFLQQGIALTLILVSLTGCGGRSSEPAVTTAPATFTPRPVAPTPTPTPTPSAPPQGNAPPFEPSGGEVEVRIPFDIYSQGELPPDEPPECVNTIPFDIVMEGSRTMIEGEGAIVCRFVDTPAESPITFHVVLEFEGVLRGERLPPTVDKPSGWLDAYLNLDGAITQFYVGYPEEAENPCPESNPCRIPTAEVIPLPFAFEEGSTITTPWTFVLHLR